MCFWQEVERLGISNSQKLFKKMLSARRTRRNSRHAVESVEAATAKPSEHILSEMAANEKPLHSGKP